MSESDQLSPCDAIGKEVVELLNVRSLVTDSHGYRTCLILEAFFISTLGMSTGYHEDGQPGVMCSNAAIKALIKCKIGKLNRLELLEIAIAGGARTGSALLDDNQLKELVAEAVLNAVHAAAPAYSWS